MIKGQLIQLDDVGIAALVIGVATLAGLLSDLVFFTVKPVVFIDILLYLLVAIKTQRGLAVSVKAVMTL